MWRRNLTVFILLAPMVSACGQSVSVVADPTDLIEKVGFIDLEDLPVPFSTEEAYHQAESGVFLLPGSEPDRLLIAVFGNTCRPRVTAAAPDVTGPPQLNVAVSYSPYSTCGEALVMWPVEVILTREVDLASVIVEVTTSW